MTDAAPPFRFSRESQIRIDRDGAFWHEGERVEHVGLATALASWIGIDPGTGRYVLRNTMDWCYITVDDAPIVVQSARLDASGRLQLNLSDGSSETLDPVTLRLGADDVPYCTVRSRTLPARFSRAAAFALLDHADLPPDGQGPATLVLPTGSFEIAPAGAPSTPPAALVTLYTRTGCHLCDDVASLLCTLRDSETFALETVDVDTDERLRERFGAEVPVVCINGRKAFKFRMTADAFRASLARAAMGSEAPTTRSDEPAA